MKSRRDEIARLERRIPDARTSSAARTQKLDARDGWSSTSATRSSRMVRARLEKSAEQHRDAARDASPA